MDGTSANQFRAVHMNQIPIVEDLLTLNILLFDIDIVDENIIGELARQNVQKYDSSVQLLRNNRHICYVIFINAVFQSFSCNEWHVFFSTTISLELHLTSCSEQDKHVYPKNVYRIRENLFNKWNSIWIEYTKEQVPSTSSAVLILNPFVCKKEASKTLIQQSGLENILQFQSSIRQTLSSNQSFYATVILPNLLHRP